MAPIEAYSLIDSAMYHLRLIIKDDDKETYTKDDLYELLDKVVLTKDWLRNK